MKHQAWLATFAAGLGLLAVTGHTQTPDDNFGNRIDSLSAYELPALPEPVDSYGLSATAGQWQQGVIDLTGGLGYNSNPAQTPAGTGGWFLTALPKFQKKYVWNAQQSLTLLGAVEFFGYESSLRSSNSMEPSLTATLDRQMNRTWKVTFTGKVNLLRIDDTSLVRALRGSVDLARTNATGDYTLLGSAFIEARDALTPVTDPRRNRDATRIGAGPSVVWKLANAKLTAGYAHTWTTARGSDEDLQADTFQMRWAESSPQTNFALEKAEFSYESRRGDHPHSRIISGGARDDDTTRASLVLRYVSTAQLSAMKLQGATQPKQRWRGMVAWTTQDSTLTNGNFDAWTASLTYNRVF